MFQEVSNERQVGACDKCGVSPQNRAPAFMNDYCLWAENNLLPYIFDTLAQINITEKHGEALAILFGERSGLQRRDPVLTGISFEISMCFLYLGRISLHFGRISGSWRHLGTLWDTPLKKMRKT